MRWPAAADLLTPRFARPVAVSAARRREARGRRPGRSDEAGPGGKGGLRNRCGEAGPQALHLFARANRCVLDGDSLNT